MSLLQMPNLNLPAPQTVEKAKILGDSSFHPSNPISFLHSQPLWKPVPESNCMQKCFRGRLSVPKNQCATST